MRLSRFNRDRNLFMLVAFVAAAASIKMFATGEAAWAVIAALLFVPLLAALRYLMRCQRCGRSMLWWSARNTRSWDLFGAIDRLETCPYCGYRLVNGRATPRARGP